MNERTGLLIAFDGIDSSGKNTQVQQLIKRLRFMGHLVHHYNSPDYTTPIGQEIKRGLQNKDGSWQRRPWPEKMRLFAANRAEHRDEVRQALKRQEIVVYDRYVASSLAFMTIEATTPATVDTKRLEVQSAVAECEYQEHGMPREHVSYFLDVPPDVSAALLVARKRTKQEDDEYTDHLEVQRRLYNEYDVLCNSQPNRYRRIGCVIGEALLPVDDVAELLWEDLRLRFPFLEKDHG